MIDDLKKDGYSIKMIADDSSTMLHKGNKSKIAIILDDQTSYESYRLTRECMSEYKEIRIFNKVKEK